MLDPRQVANLLRLQRAGCPLDPMRFPPIASPIALRQLGDGCVYAVAGGTALLWCSLVRATAPLVAIRGIQLMADWLPAPLQWAPPAGQSYPEWLESLRCGIDPRKVLNCRLCRRDAALTRGLAAFGVWFGYAAGLDMKAISWPVMGTFWAQDQNRVRYPFPVHFDRQFPDGKTFRL